MSTLTFANVDDRDEFSREFAEAVAAGHLVDDEYDRAAYTAIWLAGSRWLTEHRHSRRVAHVLGDIRRKRAGAQTAHTAHGRRTESTTMTFPTTHAEFVQLTEKIGQCFDRALGQGWLKEADRKEFESSARCTPRLLDDDAAIENMARVAHILNGGTTADLAPPSGQTAAAPGRVPAFEHVVDDNTPPNLDKEALALHGQVIEHMRGSRHDYFTALADLAKVHELNDWSDAPPRAAFEEGVTAAKQWIAENPALAGEARDALAWAQEQLAEHVRTALTLRREGVSYSDARGIMEAEDRIAALEAEYAELDASDVPWRNTSELTGTDRPRPWSEEDWERDQRRADAGGVEMPREAWEVAANQGEDLAHTLISASREEELLAARSRLAAEREDGRARAAARRAEALTKVLDERAQERVRQANERMQRRIG